MFQLFFFVLLLAGSHFVVAGQMVKLSYDTIDKCLLLKKNSFICNHFNQFYTGIYILSVFEKICNKMMYIRLLSTKKRPQSKSLEFIFPFLTSIKNFLFKGNFISCFSFFLVDDFCIYLRCLYVFVSQHFRYRKNVGTCRHLQCCIRMPKAVKCNMFFN